MPSPTPVIGAELTAYVPDDTDQIALGYTVVRFYEAASQDGSYSLVGTVTLAAGQGDYSYNNTAALSTDWFYWALYGATPGEGPASFISRVGPPRSTRKAIRQGAGERLELLEVVTATGSSATVFTAPELIDADRSLYEVASRYARPVSGAYAGATRRVRAGSNGYTNTTGQVTVVRTFGGTLAGTTEVEMWQPLGGADPSAKLDDALNDARQRLWWQDTFYFTTDDTVSEYAMPSGMKVGSIHRVEWAIDTYPSHPGWRPVGWFDLIEDAGQPLLSVLYTATGNAMLPAGKVVRVVYNRCSERLESDGDYVGVPLEWAIAETAFQFLQQRISPNASKEQLAAVANAAQVVGQDCMEKRATWMPQAPSPHTRIAR